MKIEIRRVRETTFQCLIIENGKAIASGTGPSPGGALESAYRSLGKYVVLNSAIEPWPKEEE